MKKLNSAECKKIGGGFSLYETKHWLVLDLHKDDKFNYVDDHLSFTLDWTSITSIISKDGSQISVIPCDNGVTFGNLKVSGKDGRFLITNLTA